MCVERDREEVHFNELAHVIMEAGKFKICRVDHPAGDLGNSPRCSSSLKAVCKQDSFLLKARSVFVLVRPSTDWMRPTTLWRVICFNQSPPI